jgi:hypothetical protein
MRKSELVMNRLNRAETLICQAISEVEKVLQMDESGDGESGGKFMMGAESLIDLINELGYEIAMPMQVEEEDREEEIAVLERRLAVLRAG